MTTRTTLLPLLAMLAVTAGAGAVHAQEAPAVETGYVVGSPDLLEVRVWRHEDLSGEFTVAADGTIGLPLVGAVAVAGQTVPQIEAEVTRRLADGFLRQPQVSVTVKAVRSKQVFVMGEVQLPGPVPLTGDLTLIEALARAGALTDTVGGQVVVMRRPATGDSGRGPALPGTPEADEIHRLDINELRTGRVSENVSLQNGDTIFVTRADLLFVHGQVNAPGSYAVEQGMTVLRAITIAGGATRLGALNRVHIRRIMDGEITDIDVELTDLVQPGDEIVVPTRRI